MFEKVKRFAKKIATSKKTQMTCLMVMCGVTALMAQTTAGDYSANGGTSCKILAAVRFLQSRMNKPHRKAVISLGQVKAMFPLL